MQRSDGQTVQRSNGAEAPKPRIDAWDAGLTDQQRWDAYDRLRRLPWQKVSLWAAEEFGVEPPSRSGLYRFASRLRKLESAHRLECALAARDEAGALVAAETDDRTLVAAYKTLAQDLALKGDAKTAETYTRMALQLADSARRRAELDLKGRAQKTRDEQLRLAREKFEAAERREDAAKAALGDTRLTDEAKIAKMKEIFG